MKRRDFLGGLGVGGLLSLAPGLAAAAGPARYGRLLILVELKGGNDGLNTLVPFADPAYYALRPRLAIRREDVLPVADGLGFHPSLQPLLPSWQNGEMSILQGVGYPQPNLSHFRSIEIWDTASKSDEYLQQGWLARTFRREPAPAGFATDGVVLGSQDIGPFSGGGRVVVLGNPGEFARMASLVKEGGTDGGGALGHIRRVEADIRQAAARLGGGGPSSALRTDFPQTGFGASIRTACQVLASGVELAVLRVSLGGFDTHQNQAGTHANLLRQLAEGLVALKAALIELRLWDRSLVLTYAEFGRRPRENQSGGTDHGTASVHFALGGAVRRGIEGGAPDLDRLDTEGNLAYGIDFRRVYATVLERWWGIDSREILGGRYVPLGFVA